MDRRFVFFTQFFGLCFLPASLPHQYFLIEVAHTWSAARDHCWGQRADLARVENEAQLEAVVEVSQRYFQGHVWIGLHHKPSDWRWSMQKEGTPAGAELQLWAPTEPNDPTQGKENCVFTMAGLWYDAPCSYEIAFICSTGAADRPYLVPVDLKVTWSQAQSFCRKNYVDLARTSSEAENEQLKNLTAGLAHWVGLYRTPWKWTDGSVESFSKWNTAAGEPNQGVHSPCVLLHHGHWEDEHCNRKLFFVCQPVPPVMRVKLKVTADDSSGSLEDAAGDILRQLDQRVRDVGVTLMWTRQPDGKIFHRHQEVLRKSEERGCSAAGL